MLTYNTQVRRGGKERGGEGREERVMVHAYNLSTWEAEAGG
jgi:hypothetical protein